MFDTSQSKQSMFEMCSIFNDLADILKMTVISLIFNKIKINVIRIDS